MLKIYPIRTGFVQVRRPQREARSKGVLAKVTDMLFDEQWTEWLPIYTWLIEHEEGFILVDTGETSRVHERGYHPAWHPFYRRASRFSVHPDEEIGPQLQALGIAPRDVRQVVLTHLHTDHAGGLRHLTHSKCWVSQGEWQRALGLGQASRLLASSLAEMVAAGVHSLREFRAWAIRAEYASYPARRRADRSDSWSYASPRVGSRHRRSLIFPGRRHKLQPATLD